MTRRLAAVPEVAPRALGLVRVSKERDGMISPKVQQTAIADYAASRGYDLVDVVEGLDESGSRSKSAWWPRLDQAVAAVESGEYEVILVWKFSRVARHRLRWAVAIDRVEEAGGRLESATEQFDTTTSSGRLARGMLAELQAFEAERIGETWKEAHARRVAAGKPASGKDRYGYRYDRTQKLHVPHPVQGPVLADLYRRYVAGESIYSLVRWLNGHGHRTNAGGMWADRHLRRVFDSGFASGRFTQNGVLHDGVHQPLIDDALWQSYLDAREERRARPPRAERSQYLLSGLVRCARCDGAMVANAGAKNDPRGTKPRYRCARAKELGPLACVGGYVEAHIVEGFVIDWLREQAESVDTRQAAAAGAIAKKVTARSERDRLARELVRVEEAMERLALQDAERPLPPAVYRRSRGQLDEQHAALTGSLEVAERAERKAVDDPGMVAAGLLDGWESRPVEHRREVLRRLIRHVRVTAGRPGAEMEIVPTW